MTLSRLSLLLVVTSSCLFICKAGAESHVGELVAEVHERQSAANTESKGLVAIFGDSASCLPGLPPWIGLPVSAESASVPTWRRLDVLLMEGVAALHEATAAVPPESVGAPELLRRVADLEATWARYDAALRMESGEGLAPEVSLFRLELIIEAEQADLELNDLEWNWGDESSEDQDANPWSSCGRGPLRGSLSNHVGAAAAEFSPFASKVRAELRQRSIVALARARGRRPLDTSYLMVDSHDATYPEGVVLPPFAP